MCTVTWWRAADGAFGVLFNRDERRTRPASEPVGTDLAPDRTPFLAPRDPQAGGTWLLANAHGLVLGMLNHYAAVASVQAEPQSSRGGIPLRLAGNRSVRGVHSAVKSMALSDYAPFILMAWDPEETMAWTWDGAVLVSDSTPLPPVTTSSFRSQEICAWRRARYAELVRQVAPDALAGFHDDTSHTDPAFNVRMRRPDARTESVCRVTVDRTRVRFVHRREVPDGLSALDTTGAVLARL